MAGMSGDNFAKLSTRLVNAAVVRQQSSTTLDQSTAVGSKATCKTALKLPQHIC